MKKIAYFLLFLLTGLPSLLLADTLSDMRSKVRTNVRDTVSSNYRHTDALINSILNEVNQSLVADSGLIYKTTSYELSPGTSYYSLPVDLLHPAQVLFRYQNSNNVLVLEEKSRKDLYSTIPNWEYDNQNSPSYYYVSYDTSPVASSSSTRRISYIPIPGSQSTGTVTIWYFLNAPVMENDGDFPFAGLMNLQPYTDALVFYTTSRLMAIDGIYDESKYYFDLYSLMLSEFRAKAGSPPNYNPSAVGGRSQ